jgi:periplasmic protein TonB
MSLMRNAVFERDIFVSSESSGQRLSIAVSTALQAGLLAAFFILSLLGHQIVLPYSTITSVPWLPPSQSSPPRSSHTHAGTSVITRTPSFVFQPRYTPHIAIHGEDVPPPSIPSAAGCSQNCSAPLWATGMRSPSGVTYAPPQRPAISHLEEGQIQNRVQPIYPPIAKLARIEGDVVLSAVITTNGDIQQVHVVSGPPLLQEAALQAIRQWRSRPYILNGRPIEMETRITIRFRLQ